MNYSLEDYPQFPDVQAFFLLNPSGPKISESKASLVKLAYALIDDTGAPRAGFITSQWYDYKDGVFKQTDSGEIIPKFVAFVLEELAVETVVVIPFSIEPQHGHRGNAKVLSLYISVLSHNNNMGPKGSSDKIRLPDLADMTLAPLYLRGMSLLRWKLNRDIIKNNIKVLEDIARELNKGCYFISYFQKYNKDDLGKAVVKFFLDVWESSEKNRSEKLSYVILGYLQRNGSFSI